MVVVVVTVTLYLDSVLGNEYLQVSFGSFHRLSKDIFYSFKYKYLLEFSLETKCRVTSVYNLKTILRVMIFKVSAPTGA